MSDRLPLLWSTPAPDVATRLDSLLTLSAITLTTPPGWFRILDEVWLSEVWLSSLVVRRINFWIRTDAEGGEGCAAAFWNPGQTRRYLCNSTRNKQVNVPSAPPLFVQNEHTQGERWELQKKAAQRQLALQKRGPREKIVTDQRQRELTFDP